jgi:hypothetical protein
MNIGKNEVIIQLFVMAKPDPDLDPHEIKCWIQIRNETYPDPRHWLPFEELTFKHLKLV